MKKKMAAGLGIFTVGAIALASSLTVAQQNEYQLVRQFGKVKRIIEENIGIARILPRDPDICLMDEPSSALDAIHEKELLHTLNTEYGGKDPAFHFSPEQHPHRLRPDPENG